MKYAFEDDLMYSVYLPIGDENLWYKARAWCIGTIPFLDWGVNGSNFFFRKEQDAMLFRLRWL